MLNHRRDFLKQSLAASSLVALGELTIPGFLAHSAQAAQTNAAGRKLVVVQMIGGNDGLNTVVPHRQDGYLRARRSLRIPSGQIQKITDEIGLHPAMGQMAKLVEDGRLSVVQGVGYPNPDRSHFRSMEIWETARVETGALESGWLGRTIDYRSEHDKGGDIPALHLGGRVLPLALKSPKIQVPSISNLEQYKLRANSPELKRALTDSSSSVTRSDDPLLGFIQRTTVAAYKSSEKLEEVTKQKSKLANSPYGLAQRLGQIAQMIKAGFQTPIYYTSLDGFDTHANQLGSHAALLTELSDSIAEFHRDLAESKLADQVVVLAFSEFGRRVAENASAGTDHGAAAPLFLSGPVKKAGLVGEHPKFDKLDDGDLIHHTDFRNVYASLLEEWLGCPSAPIIGSGFKPMGLFA